MVVSFHYRICFYLIWFNLFGNWSLHEEIIWHKVTGGTNRYGSFVINPYPKYFRANIMHEFILVLRKGNVNSGRTQCD